MLDKSWKRFLAFSDIMLDERVSCANINKSIMERLVSDVASLKVQVSELCERKRKRQKK